MKLIVTVWEDAAKIFSRYLPIKAAISLFDDACGQVPLILPKKEEQKSLTLRLHSFQDGVECF